MRRMDIQDLERVPCPAVRLRFPNGNGRPQAPERPTIGPESGETDAGTGGAWREDGLGRLHGAGIRRHPVLIRPAVPSERRSCANGLWVWRISKPRYGVETVTADTFIGRFMTHVLPDGFHRIRHFGIMANGCRRKTLDAARAALGVTAPEPEPHDPDDSDASDETCGDEDAAESPACPHCGAPLATSPRNPGRTARPSPPIDRRGRGQGCVTGPESRPRDLRRTTRRATFSIGPETPTQPRSDFRLMALPERHQPKGSSRQIAGVKLANPGDFRPFGFAIPESDRVQHFRAAAQQIWYAKISDARPRSA